jgi:peroxiredoxin
LDKVTAAGASLVAITPELPDQTLSTVEKHALAFDVLSDAGNDVACQFGLVFTVPESTHDFYRSERINLPGTQGNERLDLPVTDTYIVEQSGVVHHAHVDIDFTKRQEAEEVVGILERMASS